MTGRARLFLCYDPADQRHHDTLWRMLQPLERAGTVQLCEVQPGDDASAEAQLAQADIVLFLASGDALASPRCLAMLERAQQARPGAPRRVVPILVRPAYWQASPWAGLQPLPRSGQPVSTCPDPDLAWVEIVAAIDQLARELATGAPEPGGRPESQPAPAKVWHIPAPSRYFTGREAALEAVRAALQAAGRAAVGQIGAVSGLGGIGKTQLALEYARRHEADYAAGFFVRADSAEQMLAGLGSLAQELGLAVQPGEAAELVRAVQRWLETHPGWLLVLDNADALEREADLQILGALCSPRGRGHVLLTTRAGDVSPLGVARPVRLRPLEPDESRQLLLRRSGRDAGTAEEAAALAELAEELGHLPLALEQAGAYIAARQMRFGSYLQMFRQRQLKLLQGRAAGSADSRTVATTWSLNMEQVRAVSAAAAAVLEVSAFLAPDAPRSCSWTGPRSWARSWRRRWRTARTAVRWRRRWSRC